MALNLSHLPKRKGVGLVRRLLPDIEAALYEGGTLKDIHTVLQSDHGLTITFNSFKVALHRVRKEQGRKAMPDAEAGKERVDANPIGGEPEASQQPQAEAPKKKRGIISPKDFRPSPEIEEELEKLTSKKYD
ncbi:hypothetical protein [uncultured Halomonas sp.]|uniref:hypothetical protein n=1 Tax=uncultured Halomonas sp. TaxID=173971 RepID=UPI0026171565|nr:hypothetical protein [uncultured Halomonas sp.]